MNLLHGPVSLSFQQKKRNWDFSPEVEYFQHKSIILCKALLGAQALDLIIQTSQHARYEVYLTISYSSQYSINIFLIRLLKLCVSNKTSKLCYQYNYLFSYKTEWNVQFMCHVKNKTWYFHTSIYQLVIIITLLENK